MYKFSLLVALLVLLGGCSKFQTYDNSIAEKDDLIISNLNFSDDYKTFYVDIKVKDDFSPSVLMKNETMNIVVKELDFKQKELMEKVQPQYIGGKNIKSEKIIQQGYTGLVLIDLTLDEEQVEQQKRAITNLRPLFSSDNLYVAFMKEKSISETFLVTDYVLNNYFVPDASSKKLYRSILSKMDEMNGKKSTYFPALKQNEVWKSIPDSVKFMVIFSNGQTYQDNAPIDEAHFALQQALVQTDKKTANFPVFYVNFQGESDEEYEIENEAENIVTYLCNQSGGQYFPHFVWVKLSQAILDENIGSLADYRLEFSNPNNKIFKGEKRWLKINVYNKDSLFATGHKAYSIGSVYHPIVINGKSDLGIIIGGGILSICLIIIIYLVFQFIVPFIRYKLFKKKYVAKYVGKNMSLNDIQVSESCYFCKAPFQEGEEIVAKCEHSMHKSCWDENEYKCPEHGRHCKEGSFYYNEQKIYDPKNAPYYLKWLLAGTIAGILSWIFFMTKNWQIGYDTLIQFIFKLFEVNPNTDIAKDLLDRFSDEFYYTPYFGLYICFFLTLFLSILSSHGHWWWKRLAFVGTKAIVAGFCGYITFVMTAIMSLTLGIGGDKLLIDWIPWTLNGFFIAFAVSFHTDIKLKKALIGAGFAIIFGLGSMYIWNFIQNSQVDTRDILLISYLIYSIGIAISLAISSPRSERYFLRVEGPVKMMDIAIYKWINAQVGERKITIGKSVDCNLQMTWDINSSISPIQAIILSKHGNIYLIPQEEGVYIGKRMVKVDAKIRLYHGDKFTIGQTIFTYIEKDV